MRIQIEKTCVICKKPRLVWVDTEVPTKNMCKSCSGKELGKANVGRKWDSLVIEKRRITLKETLKRPEIRAKYALASTGRRFTEEVKCRLKLIAKERGFPRSSQEKAWNKNRGRKNPKLSKRWVEFWQNPDYVAKQMKSRGCRPNKVELKLQTILDKVFPNEWKYVGDGQLIIGGRCPDFTNINGKKALIEHYGTYWHKDDDPQDRINKFSEFGYQCLVIWENELKDTDILITKIKNTFYSGKEIPEGFVYSSDKNERVLSKEELAKMVEGLK